jgi:hypothetical protein
MDLSLIEADLHVVGYRLRCGKSGAVEPPGAPQPAITA